MLYRWKGSMLSATETRGGARGLGLWLPRAPGCPVPAHSTSPLALCRTAGVGAGEGGRVWSGLLGQDLALGQSGGVPDPPPS